MQYEKIKYPDGQISVKLYKKINRIVERINSYEDLMFVRSLASLIPEENRDLLQIPCLFGQRSDKKFEDNQSFDLEFICEVINSCKFKHVQIFDPHSNVCMALIKNSKQQISFNFVQSAIEDIYEPIIHENIVLVSPDAGAYKKVFSYGEKLNLPVVAANKFRALDGKISLVFTGDVRDKDCLIVDDICDGGYTFYLLAKALREQGAERIYLYVSHMYASKGFTARIEESDPNSSLIKFLDGVYCTNSVKDISNEYYDGWKMKSLGNFITQYKII